MRQQRSQTKHTEFAQKVAIFGIKLCAPKIVVVFPTHLTFLPEQDMSMLPIFELSVLFPLMNQHLF